MGPRSRWNSVDDYIIENWTRVREVYDAFYLTQRRLRRHLKAAGRKLESWAGDRGYRAKVNRQWAEFRVWRPEWEKDGVPSAAYVVGAVCPVGYFSVDQPHAYYGVALDLEDDPASEIAARIRSAATSSLGSSKDHYEDWGYPVVFEVAELDDQRRAVLASQTSELSAKVVELFDRLPVLDASISAALNRE